MVHQGLKDSSSRRVCTLRYGIALLAVGAALLLRLLLGSVFQVDNPFFLVFTAVIISAWYGGVGPGLLVAALLIIASFTPLPPASPAPSVWEAEYPLAVGLFALEAVIIGVLVALSRRRANEPRHQCFTNRAEPSTTDQAAVQFNHIFGATHPAFTRLPCDEMLDALPFHIRQGLAVDAAILLLHEAPGDLLVVRAAAGLDEAVAWTVRVPVGTGVVGRIAAERQPLSVDANHHADGLTALMRTKGVRSFLGVPIISSDQVLGVIQVGTVRPRRFTQDTVELLQRMADHVGVIIAYTRIYAAERQARAAAESTQRRLAFLIEASAALTASLDEETILKRMAHLVVSSLADWCIVYVVAEDGTVDRLEVAREQETRAPRTAEFIRHYPLDLNAPHSLIARVLRTGAPELVPEVSVNWLKTVARDAELFRYIHELSLTSLMIIPLCARERVLGAIACVLTGTDRRYGPSELELMEDFVQHAAVALGNAQLYQAAQKAIRAREHFLVVAAHEFKTALTGLIGYARLLKKHKEHTAVLEERDRRALTIIAEQAESLNKLVDSLLDLSRIEMGQLTIERVSLDLRALVGRVIECFEPTLEHHAVAYHRPEHPLIIQGDALRLEQALHNLIQNAIKYSPDGGTIQVCLEQRDMSAAISVSDEGIGMPAETLSLIFHRFYRVPQTTPPHIGGVGIGLYIVKEIVTLHGGTVEVMSTAGEGSTFTLYLPLHESDPHDECAFAADVRRCAE